MKGITVNLTINIIISLIIVGGYAIYDNHKIKKYNKAIAEYVLADIEWAKEKEQQIAWLKQKTDALHEQDEQILTIIRDTIQDQIENYLR